MNAMKETIVILLVFFIRSTDLADYEDMSFTKPIRTEIVQYHDDPVTKIPMLTDSTPMPRNLNCESFAQYAFNCTVTAALLYNSSRKAPPMPSRMYDWCSAIKHLTKCAKDWNVDCKDVTNSHFNEESIAGHDHVVTNICHDSIFLIRYDNLPECIESVIDKWEMCYSKFKEVVDIQKNTSREWTHYEQHFYLCCARAQFRRCTLDVVFKATSNCSHQQGLTLQRFSVVVSEGDVYQDCSFNMVYASCPGGDPRPGTIGMSKFRASSSRKSSGHSITPRYSLLWLACVLVIVCFCLERNFKFFQL